MLATLKSQLVSLIKELGYNIGDSGTYKEAFPWLMIRTGNYKRMDMYDIRTDNITLTIDIFSTYAGEKEIIEIVDDISDNIWELRDTNPAIKYIFQSDLKIIDDQGTGPVRKHGVLSYQFALSSGLTEVEDNENENTGGD